MLLHDTIRHSSAISQILAHRHPLNLYGIMQL